jgi:hypothetical protein
MRMKWLKYLLLGGIPEDLHPKRYSPIPHQLLQ